MEMLKSLPWEIINGIIALIAIGISWYIFRKQLLKKEITFTKPQYFSLFAFDKHLENDFNIKYKGIEVKNLHTCSFTVSNSGKIPIKASDFDHPIFVHIEDIETIFSYEIMKKSPSNLKVEVVKDLLTNSLEIKPHLLNPGESYDLNIVFDGAKPNLVIDSRLEGVTEVKLFEDKKRTKNKYFSLITQGLALGFITVITILDIANTEFNVSNNIILFPFTVILFIAFFLSILYILYLVRRNKLKSF